MRKEVLKAYIYICKTCIGINQWLAIYYLIDDGQHHERISFQPILRITYFTGRIPNTVNMNSANRLGIRRASSLNRKSFAVTPGDNHITAKIHKRQLMENSTIQNRYRRVGRTNSEIQIK